MLELLRTTYIFFEAMTNITFLFCIILFCSTELLELAGFKRKLNGNEISFDLSQPRNA